MPDPRPCLISRYCALTLTCLRQYVNLKIAVFAKTRIVYGVFAKSTIFFVCPKQFYKLFLLLLSIIVNYSEIRWVKLHVQIRSIVSSEFQKSKYIHNGL